MEARNLAIVFGPTLVRTADNSMLTMITDMSHQCHITEALINYADYVFSPSDEATVPDLPVDVAALSDTDSSVLLGNLHKVGAQGKWMSWPCLQGARGKGDVGVLPGICWQGLFSGTGLSGSGGCSSRRDGAKGVDEWVTSPKQCPKGAHVLLRSMCGLAT